MQGKASTGKNVYIACYVIAAALLILLIMKDMFLILFEGIDSQTGASTGASFLTSFGLEILLMTRNFKQLFCLSWKKAIKGTIKTYFYIVVAFLIYLAALVAFLTLLVALGVLIFSLVN